MAGVASEEAGVGSSVEGISSGLRCQSGEALAEWRSSEQVENGTPSTSPPYWDTDDDDDGGPKPSDLYGRYTWKIEKFSQINKRELRSSAFEVGGYKWYILIYPQGCDVCNHLSLFLCVANHDKLLPGWSHFSQFTIAVVNKDPKKSKYSDTLHRFWKKEHDWGWKKFMELSKVSDGFLDAADTLIIKAQVQVIRERADRPFRCLDCQYRRELVRVYLTNVENTCRRFVEERQGKLGRLIEDKNRWSSFCSFWLEMDQNSKRRMSREKTDVILKVVVKHFFIEKEVTSTLVMDSLYSGLKALEGQTKSKKGRVKLLDSEEIPAPIVSVENDMFVLVDDVLLLIERAAMKPLPPKDEKGPQNRTKDGNSGEDFNKDSIERDERRLTELGCRTVEIFVLAHIFNHRIEVAYQEAVALKRQEELIREEEEAWLAEEQKAKRGGHEKEKKSKRKQGKQKRNKGKGKDKGREERSGVAVSERLQEEISGDEKKDTITEEVLPSVEKPDILEDVSDVSDSVDGTTEMPQPDSEERDASFVNWDTDTSEVHLPLEACISRVGGLSSIPNGTAEKRSTSAMDDSSSTCSTDSVPSVVNGPYKGNSYYNHQYEKSPSRWKIQRSKVSCDGSGTTEIDNHYSSTAVESGDLGDATGRNKPGECQPDTAALALQDRIPCSEQQAVKKEQEDVSLQKKSSNKNLVDMERSSKERTTAVPSSAKSPPRSPPKSASGSGQLKPESKSSAPMDAVQIKKKSLHNPQPADRAVPSTLSTQNTGIHKPESHNSSPPKSSEKPMQQQAPAMPRPSSAPLMPGPRPTAPVVSVVQSTPSLARSVSAAGRLGPEPSPATHSYVPQLFRNAIMGNSVSSASGGFAHANGFTQANAQSSGVNLSPAKTQTTFGSAPMFLQPSSDRADGNSGFSFSMVAREVFPNGPQWMESPQRDSNRSMHSEPSSLMNGIQNRSMHSEPSSLMNGIQNRSMHAESSSLINGFQNLDLYKPAHSRSREHFSTQFAAGTSGRQTPGVATDDFPHLDIINDLLDDEQSIGMVAGASRAFHSFSDGSHLLNRQLSFPSDLGGTLDLGSSTSGSCRFERTRSYHEGGFQQDYGPSLPHYDTLREYVPPASAMSNSDGHIDGLMSNHWQMTGSDLSILGMRNVEADGSPYYGHDYSNLACSVNGYTMFRPSNGH